MTKRILLFIFFFFAFLFFNSQIIKADWIEPREEYILPSYRNYDPLFAPFCPSPRGATQVFYNEGLHAIVGQDDLQSGQDKIFALGNDNFLQCFCPESGINGIQTYWQSEANLNDEEKHNLQYNFGWNFVPDGSDWGLSDSSYLAQNKPFLCLRDLRP